MNRWECFTLVECSIVSRATLCICSLWLGPHWSYFVYLFIVVQMHYTQHVLTLSCQLIIRASAHLRPLSRLQTIFVSYSNLSINFSRVSFRTSFFNHCFVLSFIALFKHCNGYDSYHLIFMFYINQVLLARCENHSECNDSSTHCYICAQRRSLDTNRAHFIFLVQIQARE